MQPRLAALPMLDSSLVACTASLSPPGQLAGSLVWCPLSARTQQP